MFYLIKTSLLLTVGMVSIFFIFGLLLGTLENATTKILFRKFGEKSIILTGIIGTTIHELSHFIMCKIFLHKVSDMKLFSLKIKGNELGYVNHSFNKKSPYERIGNFFIGIAPILLGTTLIIVLFRLFLPLSWNVVMDSNNLANYRDLTINFNFGKLLTELLKSGLLIIKSLFTWNNITSIKFWIFLFIAISISSHMSLSKADIKNSLDGIIFIFLLSFIVSGILLIFGVNDKTLMELILNYNVLIIGFLFFALIFSLISYVIAKLITII